MKKWLENTVEAFIKSDIKDIRNYTFKFARKITKAILNEDKNQIEQLIDDSAEIRDNIEFNEEVNRNKEFYYGYWYAYENIANRIFENNDTIENIDGIIESNEKLRILVKFLGKEKAARQKDIAEHLGLKSNELANFMETDYVKKADILSKNRIGRNVIYSLNSKGRQYFKDKTSDIKNNYSKEDIYNIIEYIKKGNEKSELFIESAPGLDESVIRMIHDLSINEEILEASKYKNKLYYKNENIIRRKKINGEKKSRYIGIEKNKKPKRTSDISA